MNILRKIHDHVQVRMHAPRVAHRPCASMASGAPQPTPAAPMLRAAIKPRAALVEAPTTPKTAQGPIIINGQVLHSITQERLELVGTMDDYVEREIVPLLKPVDKCWQPTDYLPAPESPDFLDAVRVRRCLVAGCNLLQAHHFCFAVEGHGAAQAHRVAA